jgi:hypothetical protein
LETTPVLPEEEAAYRQVSPLAVIALLLGAASLVAFVGPAFYWIPAAAIGAGLLALGKIGRSEGSLAGEGLARLGMALALGCVAAGLVRESVRDSLFQQQAEKTARQWLDALAEGRTKDARELLSADGAASLVPQREPGQEPISKEDGEAIILDALRSDSLTRALGDKGQALTVDEAPPPIVDGGRTVMGLTFTLAKPGGDDHRHLTVQLSRTPHFESEGRPWRIDRWQLEAPHAGH